VRTFHQKEFTMEASNTPNPAQAGELVRAERQRLGLTVRQFGKAVGASGGTICRLENGQHYPRRALAQRLSHLLGVPVERFYA
jgi:transcriptional regulator with XRE-family HTH domain